MSGFKVLRILKNLIIEFLFEKDSNGKNRSFSEIIAKVLHLLRCIFRFSYHYIWLKMYKVIRRKKIIGIFLVESLGDIVACEPISRYARTKYPNEFIVWCVRKEYRELIESNPNINKMLVIFCFTESKALQLSGIFDVVIDLQLLGTVCRRCRLYFSKREGNNQIDFKNYYNRGNLLGSFCQSGDLPVLNEPPKVYIPQRCTESVTQMGLLKDFVTIHCNSNDLLRDWQDVKWKEFIDIILSVYPVSVVEIGLSSSLNIANNPKYKNLCGKLTILETAEVIRQSRFFIGVDSGPAHLANAVDTYGIILKGEFAGFKNYMPYSGRYQDGSNIEIINEDGPTSNISVKRVVDAVKRAMVKTESDKIIHSISCC